MRHDRLDARAFALLLACCCFWGFQQVLVKATVAEAPPLLQASLRFALAFLTLVAWCRWRGIGLSLRDGSLPGGLLAGPRSCAVLSRAPPRTPHVRRSSALPCQL